jgi:CHAT domain-containing protein
LRLSQPGGEVLGRTALDGDDAVGAAAEIHRVLTRVWQHQGGNRQDVAEFHAAAQQLAAATLGEPIRRLLSEVADDTLRLELAPDLLHVPWELLRIGEASLAERFAVGRVLPPHTDVPTPHTSPTRERGTEGAPSSDAPSSLAHRASEATIRLLLWANPQFNLLHAEEECLRLRRLVQRRAGARLDVAVNRRNLTSAELLAEVARCDWLHFAGHAVAQGGQRGWQTADGVLTGEDILRADQSWPRLIVAHACASGQTSSAGRIGLVEAFLRRGVRHYVAVWTPLLDRHGEDFAACFYDGLLDGQPIGLALRATRRRLAEEFRWTDLERANYVLYGEPEECPLPARPSSAASATPNGRCAADLSGDESLLPPTRGRRGADGPRRRLGLPVTASTDTGSPGSGRPRGACGLAANRCFHRRGVGGGRHGDSRVRRDP